MLSPSRSVRPVGDRAFLVQFATLGEVLSMYEALVEHPLEGQVDVVAAAETVLVTANSAAAARRWPALLRAIDASRPTTGDDMLVTIDVVYDGEDLDEVAELTGLGRDGVIAAHTSQHWTAAFGGFAPGFAYLVGDDRLLVPRRRTPRHAVPAGSVALADAYSAVYPRVSPGGWQLIGRTDAEMWSLDREQPALVQPGNRVQFRAVRDVVAADTAVSTPTLSGTSSDSAAGTAGLVVVQPGLQTTVQDLGRPGLANLGVAGAGALDRGAVRRSNRLAGNPATAAVLENALGGLVLEARSDQVLAVTGASVSVEVTGGTHLARRVPTDAPFALHAGERMTLGTPEWGVRSYVAVRGGFDVPEVLGSRSTDSMSGLGPVPLRAGTELSVALAPPTSVVGAPEPTPQPPAEVTDLRFVLGPRDDWFSSETLAAFTAGTYTVTAQSNRIGLRLDGLSLTRSRAGELPSEGTVSGAIQLPASGLPVLFLADHPVTGGYPVLGVVLHADLDLAAQLGTGAQIRFVPVSLPVTSSSSSPAGADSPVPPATRITPAADTASGTIASATTTPNES
ncbi:5-oxoprolinase/urea amidolyase family protein [Cryobacterium psychrophilum]|uniref:5-oxoprolinase/urea amidolyase family protein n=1 Tax=Cryobacterium psychrophilum TaxID=41988 RepID=A0A4Y8KQR5_9MICO|nr:5-oxoprolinase/urea amidolyase family protein [Cryobacterium psychrophilum]TDW29398.1 KipI family sensor histidine kinase inhibitor [Cryobacterium psychrophilum]TFD81459.1 5-oxoprolinase/urea amidolyase family protein [Cryobacterium psychrophilum]